MMLMLAESITGELYAQKSSAENIFEIPANTITKVFFVDLGKENKIKIELVNQDDLRSLSNLDSILQVFIQDLEPLKDSLTDDLRSKRIDYLIEPSGKNKIRIMQFTPTGSSYLVNGGSVAALKIAQDTVNILLKANGGIEKMFRKKIPGFHYYRVSFFINNLSDLANYRDGHLQNIIRKVEKSASDKWVGGKDGMMHVKSEPTISSDSWKGQVAGGNDYLNLRLNADIQNYKNYFIPSLSFGFTIVTNRKNVKREYSLMSESHFSFEKNATGKLQTFRNSFVTIAFSQYKVENEKRSIGFDPSFSLGYLIRQRGSVYEKNTFRLGFGRALLCGDRLKIEPLIYFNNFFKGITPGIRLSL